MPTTPSYYKILVISDYRTVGSSRPEAEIFIRLAQLGHKVCILSHGEATFYNQRFRSFGIEVIEKHPTRKISRAYIRFLRTLVLEHEFDFVHVFNSKGLTNAVWALMGIKTKLIAYRGFAGQTHWYDPMMYTKYFHPRVDHIICVSKDIEKILLKNMPGGHARLSTIPKGHDPKWYSEVIPVDRSVHGFSTEDILVCFLANVRPFKGLDYVLQSTHLLPSDLPVHLLFIGNGYEKENIRQQIGSSPWRNKIHVLGFQSDALSVLATCNSLIQASTHGEGLSKSVVESMFLGIAPIITDIPGNKGLVDDGQSGWIVPVKDPLAISKALIEMATDKTERERRGANAREHMQLHYHIDQTVEGYLRLYAKL
jgi:glycosyltransferase involved in cell wall biosynthesis